MATLTTALDTDFTPAAGDFIVQVTGGFGLLMRRNSAGAAMAQAASNVNGAVIVSNPVAGAVWQIRVAPGSQSQGMAVQADQ